MPVPDLNLLRALHVLLEERQVAAAAQRMGLSPSAMSRTLARLRDATGDPLLVRAGRSMVPTPRALAMQADVAQALAQSEALLQPQGPIEPAELEAVFTLGCSEGIAAGLAPALLRAVAAQAPRVRLRFVSDPPLTEGLRTGALDLGIGVRHPRIPPELRSLALFREPFVGVMRPDHPCRHEAVATLEHFCELGHVALDRHVPAQGPRVGPIDRRLAELGHQRRIGATVGTFGTALSVVSATDLIAAVPASETRRAGDLHVFALPFAVPSVPLFLFWHPAVDAEPAQHWLRGLLRQVAASIPTGADAAAAAAAPA